MCVIMTGKYSCNGLTDKSMVLYGFFVYKKQITHLDKITARKTWTDKGFGNKQYNYENLSSLGKVKST